MHTRNPDVLVAALEAIAAKRDTFAEHPRWSKRLHPMLAEVRDASYDIGTLVANNQCAQIAQQALDATEPEVIDHE